jgi:hypothetical protein
LNQLSPSLSMFGQSKICPILLADLHKTGSAWLRFTRHYLKVVCSENFEKLSLSQTASIALAKSFYARLDSCFSSQTLIT